MPNLLTTTGRIPRSTFWVCLLIFWAIGGIATFVGEKFLAESQQWILGLLLFPLMVIMLIVQVKRWHDRDKSGWWVFINLIPCIGGIWALIECGFLKGTTGDNRFGPDPLQQSPPTLA
jgi:uncharacterized membrane protein YhaH (DUF805 family)